MQEKIDIFKRILKSEHCVSYLDEAVSAILKKLNFCPFCDEYFIDSPTLIQHLKKEHSERIASKIFKVEEHEVNEGAETIYICPHCCYAVDNNEPSPTSVIMTHIDDHTRAIGPSARMSFQISTDKKLIQTYINGKAEVKLFCCSICTDIFSDSESLLNHFYFKHSNANSKIIPDKTIQLIVESAKDFPERKNSKIKQKTRYKF